MILALTTLITDALCFPSASSELSHLGECFQWLYA